MLSFRPIELRDKPAFDRAFRSLGDDICDCSFAVQYIWRGKFFTEFCEDGGAVYVRSMEGSNYLYGFPAGGDLARSLDELAAFCAGEGHALRLGLLSGAMRDAVEAAAPGRFAFEPLRDEADYLYDAGKMISLAGKKLHAKRNFINRFRAEYDGRWAFEAFDPEGCLAELYEYENQWCRDNRTSEGDLLNERFAISSFLENCETLDGRGGVLRLDGRIIGFSLGTYITDDVFCVHIEKADWQIPGAYQLLCNEMARMYAATAKWVNREDDMGIEGLRQAKLSYQPEIIQMKYVGIPA